MKFLGFILLSLLLASCNGGGGASFENLENEPVETNDPTIDGDVIISGFTPTANPIVLVAGLNTFAVQIDSGAGNNVTYDFRLDGVSVQNSTSPFYVLTGAGVVAGNHTLEVIASNPVSEDTHTFSIFKNTPPVVTLVSTNPVNPSVISCIGGTFVMNTSATDADGDAITFSFLLNGATGSPALSNSTTATTATTTFTPTCGMVGNANVTVRVTDTSGEFDDETVAVSVSNPTQASITGFSPTASPVIISSTGTQQFIISPDGAAPFTIVWTLTPGGVVAGCANQTSCTFNGGGSYVGSYTLNVELNDSNSTSDDMDFNIMFNAPPAFTASTYTVTSGGVAGASSVDTLVNFNCSDTVQFSATLNDQNFGDAGQTHSITWTYGGIAITDPSIDQMFSVSTNTASNPMTSTLTFNPACDSASLQGRKEVKIVVTDGLESTADTWDVYTSYLSTYCLNLEDGEVCTLAGTPGLGTGLHTVNDATKIRIRPGRIIQGPAAGTYFISDSTNGIVWFYNDNSAGTYNFKTCTDTACSAGVNQFTTISVGPKRLVALVGTGVPGLGTNNQIATNFYLNTPAGMAWDDTNKALYISDYANNRVLKILYDPASTSTSLGKPQVFAGGTCTAIASCASTNTAGTTDTATAHKCTGPVDLVLNGTDLYTACYGNGAGEYTLKKFNTSTLVGSNLIMNNAAITEGPMNGTAKSPGIYAMVKHPLEDALIISTPASYCNIFVANFSGSPSFYGAAVGGAVEPSANSFMRLTRNTTACNTTSTAGFRWDNTAGTLRAYSLYPRVRGGVLEGVYFTNNANHHVGFLNLTNATTVTVGGIAVAPGFFARVWGSGGAGYTRPASGASVPAVFNAPLGAIETSAGLWVSDTVNHRVAMLNTYVNDGASSDVLGYLKNGEYLGDSNVSPTTNSLNDPTSLHYSAEENRLYISDVLNYRIRYIDLDVGTLKTEISNGASVAAANVTADNLLPNANGLVTPRDIFFVEDLDILLYGSSGSNSHHVRAYNKNTSGTFDTIVGTDVNVGRVSAVAGRNNVAATNWVQGTMNNQPATLAPVALNNVWGIMGDMAGTYIRLANNSNHCILKVDNTRTISQEIGTCGTTAGTNYYPAAGPINDGAFASATFYNPRDIEVDPDYASDGNFFITDGGLATTSINGLRYANFSSSTVSIKNPLGSTIEIYPGEITTIVDGVNTFITGVAAFNNWICYSQGAFATVLSATPQNVICFDRSGANPVKVIGKSSGAIKGAIQREFEHEGVPSESITLAEPSGLAFDSEGNLYIAERRTHSIRMVKKWW